MLLTDYLQGPRKAVQQVYHEILALNLAKIEVAAVRKLSPIQDKPFGIYNRIYVVA